MACEIKSKAACADVIALLNTARDQLLMSVYPIVLFLFLFFSHTHPVMDTQHIQRERVSPKAGEGGRHPGPDQRDLTSRPCHAADR